MKNAARFSVVAAVWLTLISGCTMAEKVGNSHAIMSYDEYSSTDRIVPYVRAYGFREGQLCVVGVGHTYTAGDEVSGLVWSEWTAFKPTVAFFEGTDWTMGTGPEVMERYGEPAFVRFMAFVNRVPITSIEPDLVDEIQHLQQFWSDQKIRSFYALRWAAERVKASGSVPSSEEMSSFLQSYFPRLDSFSTSPGSTKELEVFLSQNMPALGHWKNSNLDWFDPTISTNEFNEIARESGRFRDRAMLDVLLREVHQGERVFIAVGSVHAHMLGPALAEALGESKVVPGGAQQCVARDI
ncbi:hypothetical protein [Sinimarinibacterium flocculans]|uniref:hypothetical protein n=1 Tax=Sinimarinibacterium flocculans TaxID=985250 RepID=UPI0035188AAB